MTEGRVERAVRAADAGYALALTSADLGQLEALLAPGFVLIDVLSGARVNKAELLPLIASGSLRFERLETTVERVLRLGAASIVLGLSRMAGAYEGQPFEARSCYTHVFARSAGGWRMVLAQGTKLADA